MKLLHLLLSLCLAILLCTAPLIQAQTAPTVQAAPPTPPNGPGGSDGSPPPPPTMDTTVFLPDISTTVDGYAG
ncbi:uncharacterized protein LOC6567298 [Drosophila grimshawi]|uniref:GH18652 n=1 Tax=Drosophila grimshawi TaxID=7222 RepID=B4JS75_DROGR|nr:uncharacterized protein LOC6567298 [Drosophila grimshawi]EDV94615.1 GH18652 [Drosophila grimshawi]